MQEIEVSFVSTTDLETVGAYISIDVLVKYTYTVAQLGYFGEAALPLLFS